MGQCAVTGSIVPEDELVTIQGQRVCAEGKAILLEHLRAGVALPGELERPTVLRRFGCIFVDGIIMGVAGAIIGGVAGGAMGVGGTRVGGIAFVATISLLTNTFTLLYFALMHGSRGQTVGKMAGKLVVVNLDGSPIGMRTAFARALAYSFQHSGIRSLEFT